MKKSTQLLLITLCALTAPLINAFPIYIKNDTGDAKTGYSVKVIVNGITASPISLSPQQIKGLERAGTPLDHTDFNRIEIESVSGLYTYKTDIRKADLESIKQSFEKHSEPSKKGYVPCIYIKAGYTGWYIQSGWTKL